MKQIFQNVKNGETTVENVPCPTCKKGHVLVKTTHTLISAGTERMLVDFGKSSYFEKMRQQPEKVKMVVDKVKSDGLLQTIDSVKSKLDQPLALGYSNVGTVIKVGEGVEDLKVGDRVVSNGKHSEIVNVPKNLCALIPEGVSNEDAVFTVVGSIALQGIRLIAPTIGETIVVTGLGLIGLLAVQILVANGCHVLGIDLDPVKTELARSFGAETVTLGKGEDPLLVANRFSRGRGVDGVIITASTNSNDPIHQAATMCRSQGRIVLVGVVGLDLKRSDFYEKQISFQVSCSYGPGRYDPKYEDKGNDYPIGYVRWTEKRNFEAVIDLIASKGVSVNRLKTSRFDIDQASQAYEKLLSSKAELGILLEYNSEETESTRTIPLNLPHFNGAPAEKVVVGVIGAGNHAGRALIPAFKDTGARLKYIASSQGMTGTHYGKKFGFENNTTDTATIFKDTELNTVVIATQHDSHAKFVLEAIKAGKNVFVEKPLALSADELDGIESAYRLSVENGSAPAIMVGYNRRFAPLVQTMKQALNNIEPMVITYTCNAGFIPFDSWVHDQRKGGGRIIGEACHFIDIARFLAGSRITKTSVSAMQPSQGHPQVHDVVSISLTFENGSIATINYLANGHRSFPKERIEVFQSGSIAVLNNFVEIKGYGLKAFNRIKRYRQDKGVKNCAKSFVDSIIAGKPSPIPLQQIIEVSRVCVNVMKQLHSIDRG
ncbi:bi-domain-containing oxidoreductase [Akkermansiaceae bacterium]|nr:bi-domain-containing oxidoreductase [Akkermansiaceae bacterium]